MEIGHQRTLTSRHTMPPPGALAHIDAAFVASPSTVCACKKPPTARSTYLGLDVGANGIFADPAPHREELLPRSSEKPEKISRRVRGRGV